MQTDLQRQQMFLALPQRLLTRCESTHDVIEATEGAEQTSTAKSRVLYHMADREHIYNIHNPKEANLTY